MMKKMTAIILLFTVVFTIMLTGCGKHSEATTPTEEVVATEVATTKTTEKATAPMEATPSEVKPVSEPTVVETEEPTETVKVNEKWELSEDYVLYSPSGNRVNLVDKFPKIADQISYSKLLVDNYDQRSILMIGYNTLVLAEEAEDEINIISLSSDSKVISYTIAYDTIYWYNLNREVWSSDWISYNPNAKLFCEDAIEVSPFTDECEGAIVSEDKANRIGPGGIPIYSPYPEETKKD